MHLSKRDGWSDEKTAAVSEPELLVCLLDFFIFCEDMMRNDYDSTSMLEGLHFDQDFPKHYCPDS